MKNLQNRIALVTGAGTGIGAAIARRLAAEGSSVICVGRTANRLHHTVEAIRAAGGTAEARACDIADETHRSAMIEEMLARFHRIDILVNNAATAESMPADQIPPISLNHQFNTNVAAPIYLSLKLIPAMRHAGWGRIVNISSRKALPPSPDDTTNEGASGVLFYATTKAALNRFTAGLATALVDTGITVNALAPTSVVRTEAIEEMLTRYPGASNTPGWSEEPIEAIAECIIALCEPASAKISGQALSTLEYLESRQRNILSLDGTGVIA